MRDPEPAKRNAQPKAAFDMTSHNRAYGRAATLDAHHISHHAAHHAVVHHGAGGGLMIHYGAAVCWLPCCACALFVAAIAASTATASVKLLFAFMPSLPMAS